MNVVVFGLSELVTYFQDNVNTLYGGGGIQVAYAVNPFVNSGNYSVPLINRVEALNLYRQKKIDAYVFAMGFFNGQPVVRSMIRDLKLRGVKNIFVCDISPNKMFLFRHDTSKYFTPHIETNLIDACNLNCRACTHFAGIFDRNDIYPIENFYRDIKQLSESVDVLRFFLLGGEPFLLKNLNEYIDVSRQVFSKSQITILTNGLLLPTTDDKIFESIRRNSIQVSITEYKPTTKIKNKIVEILEREKISYTFGKQVEQFCLSFSHNLQPVDVKQSMQFCHSPVCRFLRNGKIYKCPTDGLVYKYVEKFNLHGRIPPSMGVDIYSKDLPLMLDSLDDKIDLCYFCADRVTSIPWEIDQNPQAENWMV